MLQLSSICLLRHELALQFHNKTLSFPSQYDSQHEDDWVSGGAVVNQGFPIFLYVSLHYFISLRQSYILSHPIPTLFFSVFLECPPLGVITLPLLLDGAWMHMYMVGSSCMYVPTNIIRIMNCCISSKL